MFSDDNIERIVFQEMNEPDWIFRLALADHYEGLGNMLLARFFRRAAEEKLSPFCSNSSAEPEVFRWGWLCNVYHAARVRSVPWSLNPDHFGSFFNGTVNFPQWNKYNSFLAACQALAEFLEAQEIVKR